MYPDEWLWGGCCRLLIDLHVFLLWLLFRVVLLVDFVQAEQGGLELLHQVLLVSLQARVLVPQLPDFDQVAVGSRESFTVDQWRSQAGSTRHRFQDVD